MTYSKRLVALLAKGSAILLLPWPVACGSGVTSRAEDDGGKDLVSRTIENLATTTSRNGRTTRNFTAPVMEEHGFARPAYEEFRRGIEVVGYDSLGMPSSRVVADYALHWTARDLWELRGNVTITDATNRRLFTQQLYWDVKIKKIYSNVDSKVEEGENVLYPEGFEADDDFSSWTFRKLKGQVGVDVEPASDSADPVGAAGSGGDAGSTSGTLEGSAGETTSGASGAPATPATPAPTTTPTTPNPFQPTPVAQPATLEALRP